MLKKNVMVISHSSIKKSLIVLNIAALLIMVAPHGVFGATILPDRYDLISSPVASDVSIHEFGFRFANNTTPVGSVSFEFCANSPIIGDGCTVPVGLNAASTALAFQTNNVGFSIHPNSTGNKIILTRAPVPPNGIGSAYRFVNITNPSAAGSYYVRIQTFSSTDGTGIDIENGGVVFALTSGVSVSAEVPPFLRFCVGVTVVSFDCSTATSFFIDFGEFSTTQPVKASSQMVAVTNAAFGYSIYISGTTLVSGNNVIPALVPQAPSSPGTSQFGINLLENTVPAVGSNPVGPGTANINPNYATPNQFRYQSGDAVVNAVTSNDYRKFTVSYIANISPAQAAGVYATTVSFICLANF